MEKAVTATQVILITYDLFDLFLIDITVFIFRDKAGVSLTSCASSELANLV